MSTLPLTVRRAIEIMGVYVLGMILIVGKNIIMPVVMAFFLAIMLLPIYRFFRSKKFPEALSIFLALLFLIVIVALLIWFFSYQVSILVNDFPEIKRNVEAHLQSLSQWLNSITGLSTQRQTQILAEQNDKLLNYAGGMLSGAAASFTSVLIFVGFITDLYFLLLLYYKNLLLRFIFLWFPVESHEKVEEAIGESQIIIKSYLDWIDHPDILCNYFAGRYFIDFWNKACHTYRSHLCLAEFNSLCRCFGW
jgi:predicted PurR-regulated permease PerM